MENIITYLPYLLIVIVVNMALGVYGKIGVEKISFDKKVFVKGIIKAVIIAGSFIGLAYVFDVVDLAKVGITPMLIMSSSILLYAGKACSKLASILGVEITKK